MNQLLNPDFDLKTFYWHYVNTSAGTITYTVVCYDNNTADVPETQEPYMIIQTSIGAIEGHIVQELENTVDARVLDVVRKHFSREFMISDGHMMLAEYVNGASGELHKHDEYGKAIFGMDLEEAYA